MDFITYLCPNFSGGLVRVEVRKGMSNYIPTIYADVIINSCHYVIVGLA